MSTSGDLESVWVGTDPAFRAAIGKAWESLVSLGLPVGAVVASSDGEVLSSGRNRVYDEPGGADPLQRTPLGHAEMNALASVPHGTEFAHCVLYSTHQPCAMCQATAQFIDIGAIRFLVSDPSAVEPGDVYMFGTGCDSRLGLGANVMFLHNVAVVAGRDSEILARNRVCEPGTVDLALELAGRRTWKDGQLTVDEALAGIWEQLNEISERSRPRP